MSGLMLKRVGPIALMAMLVCLVGCDLNGPGGGTEPVVQNPEPINLIGDWQGTLTWVTNMGNEPLKYETYPIQFSFTDSTYVSYGAGLHARGKYERYVDRILILYNELYYAAIYDLRPLPASNYPFHLEVKDDTLFMSASATTANSQWYGWQRIALVRTE